MSEMEKKCYLKSLETDVEPILLHDSQEISLGRSPLTFITSLQCSRKQAPTKEKISVTADYRANQVSVRHVGSSPSSINGKLLKNETQVMNHGDVLEFLVGQYPFKLEFTPAPDVKVSGTAKRSYETVGDKSELPKMKRERKMEGEESLLLPKNSKIGLNGVSDKKTSDQERVDMVKDISAMIGKTYDSRKQVEERLGPPQQSSQWSQAKSGSVLIYTAAGVRNSSKIAAYDLDGTLILTKSGRVFPKDMYDWQLAFPEVKSKLSQLLKDGYKIVIITNQGGIGTGRTKSSEFKSKIEKIGLALNVPIQVFIATISDIYRKPAPGIWTLLTNEYNSGIDIDMQKSFYVGDAAGRIVNWAPKKKKDFSSSDRLFAMNLKLNFYTPEEHFLNQRAGNFNLPAFIPSRLDENQPISSCEIVSKNTEVVILVGYPASGKSFFALQYLIPAGYTHVNRDTLGSWQRCVSVMESSIKNRNSVVVDNTNPDKESRKRFIDTAKALSVPCRCFVMSTEIDHAKHNNRFRELTDQSHVPVSDIIINNYKNKFEKPTLDEGFVEIVEINFVPKFSKPELKKLYTMFLLEK